MHQQYFKYLVQRVNTFVSKFKQHGTTTKSFKSSKKQLFSNAPSNVSKLVHSKNDFIPNTPSPTHHKWIPKSPPNMKTLAPSLLLQTCVSLRNGGHNHCIKSIQLINGFQTKLTEMDPKCNGFPKDVWFDYAEV